MGNDGGSIPTRRELVKEAARNPTTTELKATQTEAQAYNWTHDPLTRAVLRSPVVSDSNGKLYNKDSVLEFLLPSDSAAVSGTNTAAEGLSKDEAEKVTLGCIRSLKDVVEVRFDIETEARDGRAESWKCPITGSRLGPGSKAVYLVPCGHAFSGAAIKAVSGGEVGASRCLVCEAEYAQNDVVSILPVSSEEIARLLLRTKTLREKGLAHSLKKLVKEKGSKEKGGKKRKNRAVVEEEVVPELVVADQKESNGASEKNGVAANVHKTNGHGNKSSGTSTPTTADSKINNSSTASLTAKVMAEQEKNKKRRLENENLKSLFSNRDPSKPHGRSSDFMTRGFDIPAAAKR